MHILVNKCVCFCVYLQLLATVLSQSAKAKEHLLEQSKSVDQPPGNSTCRDEWEQEEQTGFVNEWAMKLEKHDLKKKKKCHEITFTHKQILACSEETDGQGRGCRRKCRGVWLDRKVCYISESKDSIGCRLNQWRTRNESRGGGGGRRSDSEPSELICWSLQVHRDGATACNETKRHFPQQALPAPPGLRANRAARSTKRRLMTPRQPGRGRGQLRGR